MRTGLLRGVLTGAVVLAIPMSAAADPADSTEGRWQFDGFFGGHIFSENNELGARDVETETHPKNSFAFGLRLGYWLLPQVALEAEGVALPTEAEEGNSEQFVVGYRLNALYQFDLGAVKPFVLIGAGGMSNSSERDEILMDDHDFVSHAGLGARFAVSDGFGVRADVRLLLPPSTDGSGVTTDFEGFIGLYKTFGGAEPAPVEEPPADTDGDGITDDQDQCPNEAEDKDGFEDQDGCPDPDNDGDGIADGEDKCPDQAGPAENQGCPDEDKDGDGIVDRDDKCPDQPGPRENGGCPDTDQDGDGIVDRLDKCPDQPETANQYQDEDGCPDEVPAQVKKFTGVIKGINFKINSADLTVASFRTLDAAVKVLTEYPDVRLEISGHTDDTGSAELNRDLSQRRAETVKQYFVSKGIAEDRLEARGYGPDKPIDPRKTKAARAKNRRVEFTLLAGGAQPAAGGQGEGGGQPEAAQPGAEGQPKAEPKDGGAAPDQP